MTNHELMVVFANALARNKRYKVWPLSPGQFVYLADEYDLYRIEIIDGLVKILNTTDCTYETFELADPEATERMFKKFEIDDNIEPQPFNPADVIARLIGHQHASARRMDKPILSIGRSHQ